MQYELTLAAGTWYRANTKLPPPGKPFEKKRIAYYDSGILISTSEPLIFGRDEACDIILDSAHVSRKHALIYGDNGKLFIRDTSSSGTTIIRSKENRAGGFSVGGKQTSQITLKKNAEPVELMSQDTIIFGHTDTQLVLNINAYD